MGEARLGFILVENIAACLINEIPVAELVVRIGQIAVFSGCVIKTM